MKFSKYNLLVPEQDKFILFNTLTGGCVELKNKEKDDILNNRQENFSQDDLNMFIRLGIIIEDHVDESKIVKYYHGRAKFDSKVISSTVLLTWACNLKCIYCFEDCAKSALTMNKDDAEKYIKFMINLAKGKDAKEISICLFGGEPLINFDIGEYILKEISTYCKENEIKFTSMIITNGTLLDECIIDKLIKYNCKTIQITLDGIKDIHDSRRMYKTGKGSFDDIIESLRLINSKGTSLHPVIRINIDKTNLSDTYELLKYIGKNGLDLTNCTVDFGIVRGSTEACSAYSGHCLVEGEIGDVLFELWNQAEIEGFKYNIRPMRKWIYCGLYSDNQYTITPDCEVYKCWEHTGQKEHLMGILNNDGHIINTCYAFYDWMSNDPLDNNECEKCVYLPSCGGGCGVVSYNDTKSYHSTGCFKVKGVVEKQLLKYIQNIRNHDKCRCNEHLE